MSDQDATPVSRAREALEAFISEVLQMVKVWPDAAYRRQYRLCQRLLDAYASALSDAQQQEIERLKAELAHTLAKDAEIMEAAEQEIARLTTALREIAEHPHCSYDHPTNTGHGDRGYGIGCADGHECAATMARIALKP
jgi:plasmid stabilization system protein ParE